MLSDRILEYLKQRHEFVWGFSSVAASCWFLWFMWTKLCKTRTISLHLFIYTEIYNTCTSSPTPRKVLVEKYPCDNYRLGKCTSIFSKGHPCIGFLTPDEGRVIVVTELSAQTKEHIFESKIWSSKTFILLSFLIYLFNYSIRSFKKYRRKYRKYS